MAYTDDRAGHTGPQISTQKGKNVILNKTKRREEGISLYTFKV